MPTATTATADDIARVAASLEAWRKRLLDLTKRNRALNFRPTKVSIITVVDEHPAEVFRHLYVEEKSMRFATTEAETTEVIAADVGDIDAQEWAEVEMPEAPELVPYERARLEDRHRDGFLQTLLPPEKLDRSPRRLEELSRSNADEQGSQHPVPGARHAALHRVGELRARPEGAAGPPAGAADAQKREVGVRPAGRRGRALLQSSARGVSAPIGGYRSSVAARLERHSGRLRLAGSLRRDPPARRPEGGLAESTDWFKNRGGQVERVLRFADEARSQAHREPHAPARPPRASEAQTLPSARRIDVVEPLPRRLDGYRRPQAAAYELTPGEGRRLGEDILTAPTDQILEAIRGVVAVEAPLHVDDLVGRVAARWGKKVGRRIEERIAVVLEDARRRRFLLRRDPFVYAVSQPIRVRSHSETRIPAERISPEEYREAVLMVLRTGFAFTRGDLIVEARSILGFSRTGANLEEAISRAIESLVAERVAGEGNGGIALRA